MASLSLGWFEVNESLTEAEEANGFEYEGRSGALIWLNWIIAAYIVLETIWGVFEITLANKTGLGKSRKYVESTNPTNGESAQFSYDAITHEVAFMF